jgi:hypothetical protein
MRTPESEGKGARSSAGLVVLPSKRFLLPPLTPRTLSDRLGSEHVPDDDRLLDDEPDIGLDDDVEDVDSPDGGRRRPRKSPAGDDDNDARHRPVRCAPSAANDLSPNALPLLTESFYLPR